MSEKRMNYPYAYVVNGIVQSVSLFCDRPTEDHPFYNSLIPLREYDATILGYRYIGLDDEGYGIVEEVRELIPEPQPTEQEIEQAETNTLIDYNNGLREIELETK